jgi:MFS family permease
MRELLTDRTYIRYWLAVVVSFLGDAMARVLLLFVVAQLTHDPALVALVVLFQLLPSGLMGAFIGPLVDRLSKRSLLVGADLVRVVIVLAMIPVLDSAWALLALLFLEGIGKAVFETARIAAVPSIVGPQRIPAAVALFQSTNWTVNLVGPAIGGLLIALGSNSAVLVIDAATFVVSALLLASMTVLRGQPAPAGEREPYWRSLRTGLVGVLAVPSLRFLFVMIIPVMIVLGLFTANFNAQMLIIFGLTALQFGFAQAVLAGGSVAAALLGPRLIQRYPSGNTLLLGTVALFGLGLIALAPAEWLFGGIGFAAVLAWCLAVGFCSSLFQVPVANTLLRDTPEQIRGRGVGLLNTVSVNFTVVGTAVGALAAALFSVAGSIVAAGVILIGVVVACAAYTARAQTTPSVKDPVG